MVKPLLERRTPVGGTYALLILIAFFFLLPSAFRSARLSLNNRENDVKDWLPDDFPETAELEWFANDFAGESFVLATWEGCTIEDQRLRLLEKKLLHECDTYDPGEEMSPEQAAYYRKAKEIGRDLRLLPAGRQHDNWGGEQEKWLATPEGQWYYIKPDGRLYRWEAHENGVSSAVRTINRVRGKFELTGKFVAAFGDQTDSTKTNPFYNDTSLVCAPLFHTVETGVSVAKKLSEEGGPLWPRDLTDSSRRSVVAERLAMQRLSGALFAPAVLHGFQWTVASFRDAIAPEKRAELPEEFDVLVQRQLNKLIDEDFGGDVKALASAPSAVRDDAFYSVFDAAGVDAPPRQTCLLITMTDLAKDNLAYALGRGVLGGPRGRLLQLAADSGVQPPMPPSMAPPPFNRADVESASGLVPLRMGGPPVDNIAIDEEGSITLVRLVGYSVLVGIFLSYVCFRSVKITIMVFVVGGSAAMLSMAFVGWTNGRVDAILMSMPSLVYVLGLSGAIHVINYYRDEVREGGHSGAAGRALKHAAVPCSLAALTTAIGLVSLYTSNLAPISNFGLYAAIGVIATLAVLFSYLPAALQVFITDTHRSNEKPVAEETPAKAEEPAESWLSDQWAAVGRWITGHHALVTTTCLLVLVIGSIGLTKIKTSVQLLKLFDQDARIIRDYAWLEDNFGKLVPMELVLRVPPSMQAIERVDEPTDDGSGDGIVESANESLADVDPVDATRRLGVLERVEAVARINRVVRNTLGEPGLGIVGQAMSADTFLPPLPEPDNGYWNTRSLYRKSLISGRADLLQSDYLRIEDSGPYEGSELWRISLRVDALSDVDYGHFINTLRTSVEPVLRAYDARQEILRQLCTSPTGEPAAMSGKQKVLIVGRSKPAPSSETSMLLSTFDGQDGSGAMADDTGQSQIDTEAIYYSTLNELLQGEKIARPTWVDPNSSDTPIKIDDPKWQNLIASRDAVIWVGDDEKVKASLSGAKRLIDAQAILNKDVHPSLVGDRIPDVVGSGGPDSTGLQAVYTGVVPVVYKAQRTLLASLVESIGLAFVLIALVMVMLLNPGRSFLSGLAPSNFGNGLMAGLISMIPNVFPVLLIFGLMGHWGRLVDIGTMMTASVAMGVAVDDTIHFLSWFRSYLDKGYSRIEAVVQTYRRVGPAMTQTTLVGGLGLFVFALSTFTPTQRFGTLMLVMLAAALVGDLVLLPALLAGPIGRFFKPRVGTKPPTETSPTDSSVPQPGEMAREDVEPAVPEKDGEYEASPEEESLPHLRVHFPHSGSDSKRPLKGR
ncbi:efflux RND transporter permease subunit [Stieleria varia]|uniref:MMPL family protein n=1 Tax=Stieleria varia TaxID=2528005 RepID=A0A5C6AQ16_9BACT|nr:MMPL family transporter [Stieleria varia]TWU01072.1 MMPL family protein [Stieleria varia]